MPLLGPFGILVLVGIALDLTGFALVYTALGRHGGLDRTKMLSVVFDDDSPMKRPEARRDRIMFRVGVFLTGFGVMTVFGGFSVGDDRDRAVCVNACRRQGFYGGGFAPSAQERDPQTSQPLRACVCVGPAGSVELKQDALPLPEAPR